MPELPEVETIKLGLSQKIIGLKIKSIKVLNPKSFQGNADLVLGGKITQVWRKAKMLGLEFTPRDTHGTRDTHDTFVLLMHLKMSGQLIFQPATINQLPNTRFVGGHPTKDMLGDLPNKSTRVIFELEDPRLQTLDSRLYFNDQRKFGWIKILNHKSLVLNQLLQKLGPEPLEKSFTWQLLKSKIINRKSSPIKVVILDQTVVSGVGNIYACEALYQAKIDPRRKVSDLTDEEIKRLREGIVNSLKLGIKYGGSTRTHFVNEEGKKGLFLDYANVYNRSSSPCKVCGTKIAKIKLAGRGTFYCPNCQT